MAFGILFLSTVILVIVGFSHAACLPNKFQLHNIPSDHLYWKLKKPLVIGQKGNVMKFQENTMEGIQSLIAIKADGAHVQIQLTKDNKLVLHREDSLKRMTGEDYHISNLPYSEIQKMDIRQTVALSESTTIIKGYHSTLKIPLLTTVLDLMSDQNMLLYIEMLSGPVPAGPLERQIADLTAKYLSDVINQYKFHQKVFVVSENPFTLKSLNGYDSTIVTAWWLNDKMFSPDLGNQMRIEYNDLFESDCNLMEKPNGTLFTKYLLTSGIISNITNSSFVDLSVPVYTDKKYSNEDGSNKELKEIIKSNYGDVTLGSFDVFLIEKVNDEETEADDVKLVQDLYKKGVNRFITNDVNRVKKALNKVITPYSTVKDSRANNLSNVFVCILLTLLSGKFIISLILL